MSELCNMIIVAGSTEDQVHKALVDELTQHRSWKEVPASTAGARHIQIWRSHNGLVIVELDRSWQESDLELARSLSNTCKTYCASCYYTSAGDWDAVELYAAGKSKASYSMSDCAGLWEIRKNGRKKYFRDWSGQEDLAEAEWDAATREFEEAKQKSFDQGPLADLLLEQRWHQLTPDKKYTSIELSFLDAHPASTLQQVENELDRTVVPLLAHLGFKKGKAEPWRDDVAIAYEKPLAGKRLRVQYEFGKEKIWAITQRFELLEWGEDCKQWMTTHIDIGGSEVTQFQPYRSDVHLNRACQFLASSLARDWQKIAKLAPPVAAELQEATKLEDWQRAADSFDEIWRTRLVAGERESEWIPAALVFKGGKMMVVETGKKERFTFNFDTSMVPPIGELAVGGIWETSVGTARAKELKVGSRIFKFDEEGVYKSNSDDTHQASEAKQ